jgi:hypothetical protein
VMKSRKNLSDTQIDYNNTNNTNNTSVNDLNELSIDVGYKETKEIEANEADGPLNNAIKVIEKQRDLNEKIYQDNNGWNHNLEMIAARIGERASGLRWMHKRSISYFNIRYQILGLLCIVIQAGVATAAVTQISNCSTQTNVITILVSVLMYLAAVCSSFNQFKNYGARTQNHKQAETDFSAVEEMIRIELGKYRRDRKVGYDYTEWVASRFDQVNLTSPEVPFSVERKYKQFIIGKKIADASDAIDPILVKTNNDSPNDERSSTIIRKSSTPLSTTTTIVVVPSPSSLEIPDSHKNSIVNIEVGKEKSILRKINTDVISDDNHNPNVFINTTNNDDNQDVIVDFIPRLEQQREMYEIQRFLHGSTDE